MPVQSRVPRHRYIKRGDYHRSQARPGRPDGSLPLSGNKALGPRTLGATVVEPARHAHLDDDGRPEAAALATTGYFPSEIALVLDEAIALLPEMAEAIRQRPATEPPYQTVCEGIHDFGMRHQNMMALIMASQGDLDIPLTDRSAR